MGELSGWARGSLGKITCVFCACACACVCILGNKVENGLVQVQELQRI